ncbi:hypothetical protein RND71_037949 [Anisodus tanguticus]|uniref:Uncharacterized protein n=1 Tax=Anisodus tanguticus TaxID=243964 RepID=A0AAE1QZ27_9SOLA|nr:hypothetical protein RND71_037949 [Anisodus tanguticus]
MMSVERSFEAWEEVQRHGQDLADKLAQGVTGLIQSTHISPPSFSWPYPQNSKIFDVELPSQYFIPRDFGMAVDKSAIAGVSAIFDMGNRIGQASKLFDVELPSQNFILRDFGIGVDSSAIPVVSSIFEIGNRIRQAGADFGACVNGMVHLFFRKLPVPFRQDENLGLSLVAGTDSQRPDLSITLQEDLGSLAERFRGYGYTEKDSAEDRPSEDEFFGVNLKAFKHFGRSQDDQQLNVNLLRNVESSVAARGDLWRVEASQGSSTSGNENSSLFLVQIGPVLFVRDSTLLLPVHLSKQHLLWYGYDRKFCSMKTKTFRKWDGNVFKAVPLVVYGLAVSKWSNNLRIWGWPFHQCLFTSMWRFASSPGSIPGGSQVQFLLQGEVMFNMRNYMAFNVSVLFQPLHQAFAWKRSGLMYRPTVQLSVCPTLGGSNSGLQAEITHSLKEELNIICGCALATHSSVFASLALGRSKWNGNVGSSGVVVKVETPLGNTGRPSFSIQLNSGVEF